MSEKIKGWRERAGLPASYEITGPSAVERALLEENAELRKDAERYRFIKAAVCEGYELPGGYYLADDETTNWDRTIDASMSEASA